MSTSLRVHCPSAAPTLPPLSSDDLNVLLDVMNERHSQQNGEYELPGSEGPHLPRAVEVYTAEHGFRQSALLLWLHV